MSACGLPPSYALFTSDSTITTFNLTADCTLSNSNMMNEGSWMTFNSGVFTINGNGHTITGPSNGHFIFARNAGTIVNLNEAVIRQAGSPTTYAVIADVGSRINVRNVIFRDNVAATTVTAIDNGQLYLEDVQFLNNRRGHVVTDYGSAVTVRGGGPFVAGFISITNALFQGNANSPNVIGVLGGGSNIGALELHGCIIFRENVNDEGSPAANYINAGGTITDNSTDSCSDAEAGFSYWLSLTPPPKRKKKVPTAIPTPRPPAVTCPTLSAVSGIAVRATYGLESGIQCQRIDGGGIGIQSIVDAGFIDAVDIWGYVVQGVEVCFPQAGRLLFLDARTSPRAISPLESTVVNGMTCASISTPGSIVLMPG